MATSLQWHPLLKPTSKTLTHSYNQTHLYRKPLFVKPCQIPRTTKIQSFQRSDFDGFTKKVASGEAWRDVWRSANNGFEQLLYDATKAAERINRQYSVSQRVSSLAESASYRVKELDREFEVSRRWRSFALDFSRNSPRYRKQLNDFLKTPVGRSFATIFFLWFALSGWMFRILIFSMWVLPFAAPLLIGTVANNFVIEGACPACKRKFMGYKNQVVRCAGCGNIVWQPKGDFFSKGGKGTSSRSKSDPDIIDVEFEEK